LKGKKTLQEEGGLVMEKESKADKPGITNKDLVESLLLISEASKTLALEIMLLPKNEEAEGGGENGIEPNNSQ
jgi:hypothetical protein